ncbi:phosphoglycerate kinase [Candidatus Saccharibacteria bacterium]|nr:phosphoglycerate kinase [Candidatus Saccharibacteria bacterium]
MKTIESINVKDKTVLVRVDYNVPVKKNKVLSDLRVRASLPTINYLLENGAKRIVLISHLGRPEGKINPEFTLSPVADCLRALLPDQTIGFYPTPEPGETVKIPDNIKIALLDNLRFNPGEESNDKQFIKSIIDGVGADVYVQDGFAVVHRAHASTDAVKEFLPVYAGLLLEKEIKNLDSVLNNPARPLVLIIGGSKVEDKEPLIKKFTSLADHILVGGKIAADGYKSNNKKIYVATDFDEDSTGAKLDIGPISTAEFANHIADAKTIVWNGLLGKAEDPAYATSSNIVADLIGEKSDATTIICGGDTTGFVEELMTKHKNLKYSLISTGGGASLEYLLGNHLPGLSAIKK